MQSGVVSSLPSVLQISQVFTSGYVNMETILHFFYKITNKRGTKTVFTYTHVKWFYSQSERVYYLNYFISIDCLICILIAEVIRFCYWCLWMFYRGDCFGTGWSSIQANGKDICYCYGRENQDWIGSSQSGLYSVLILCIVV